MYDNELIKEPEGSKYKVKRYYSKFGVYTFEKKENFLIKLFKKLFKEDKKPKKKFWEDKD
tara:strand:+ start:557 stop:736 length:180 start_codon:yes stop_codon:yes gene_type:complete